MLNNSHRSFASSLLRIFICGVVDVTSQESRINSAASDLNFVVVEHRMPSFRGDRAGRLQLAMVYFVAYDGTAWLCFVETAPLKYSWQWDANFFMNLCQLWWINVVLYWKDIKLIVLLQWSSRDVGFNDDYFDWYFGGGSIVDWTNWYLQLWLMGCIQ